MCNAANEAAIKSANKDHGTSIEIRQVTYLHNIVAQDHCAVKRVTRPMLGFQSFESAQSTLVGIELMHMIRKSQIEGDGAESLSAADQFYAPALSSPHPVGTRTPNRRHQYLRRNRKTGPDRMHR